MSFEVTTSEKEGVTLLAPRGRLVLGPALERFRSALDAQLERGQIRVALDFRGVDYFDSSTLGCLVVAHTKFEKAGGVLSMFGLNQRSSELLVITKLATVFRIAASELEAINLCYPDRETAHFDILSFVEQQRAAKKKPGSGA